MQKNQRMKYATQACQECQRRKVKCSEEESCTHCRVRGIPCVYSSRERVDSGQVQPSSQVAVAFSPSHFPEAPPMNTIEHRDPITVSVEERLALLENEIKRVSRLDGSRPELNRDACHPASSIRESGVSRRSIGLIPEFVADNDLFTCNNPRRLHVGLTSRFGALRDLLHSPSQIPASSRGRAVSDQNFPIQLPNPSSLRGVLGTYFQEINSVLPTLEERDITDRVFAALKTFGYSESSSLINVDLDRSSLVALLCILIALTGALTPDSSILELEQQSWSWYIQGQNLLAHRSPSVPPDLDAIWSYALSAYYLMLLGSIQSAEESISRAVRFAMEDQLHDQKTWPPCTPEVVAYRKRLWWSIYIVDKEISQLGGQPYLIREQELFVDEFSTERIIPENQSQRKQAVLSCMLSDSTSSRTLEYFQMLIAVARWWPRIWDKCFSATALKHIHNTEVELMESALLLMQSRMPAHLTWDVHKLPQYIAEGEAEPIIRRRLVLSIKMKFLRMVMRQNAVPSKDNDARLTCAIMSKQCIDDIEAYIGSGLSRRASSFFLATSLVECIYYLIMHVNLDGEAVETLQALRTAFNLLLDMSKSFGSAKAVLNALNEALSLESSDEDGYETVIDNLSRHPTAPKTVETSLPRMPSSNGHVLSEDTYQTMSIASAQRLAGNLSESTPIPSLQPDKRTQLEQSQAPNSPINTLSFPACLEDLEASYGDLEYD